MYQFKHKRILIIGSSGAGKSTLSKRLSKKWDLPLFHLDALFWNEGWVPTPKPEFKEKIQTVLEQDAWIMDGNFDSTLELRASYADLIIFLDFSRVLCTYRVFKRAWIFRGKTRPDMAPGCKEKIDVEFAKWVWRFPQNVRPHTLNILRNVKNTDICVLQNPKEVEGFLMTAPIIKNIEHHRSITT
ncbi:Adenylate kinase [Psychrobacillus sp. OK028]|uniref:DNA topology modulation protein n=1 Tax=Psychrobacillus sp. OK028 TaxID=1884359 RepID=UPI000886B9B8|nr:DNA topology modulation protein [Psychrobacillus sp. OK028]SDN41402.1 Adenylate kinase [Psychrobacillus sp. OK028]